jgi:hypothetical protein
MNDDLVSALVLLPTHSVCGRTRSGLYRFNLQFFSVVFVVGCCRRRTHKDLEV